MFHFYYLTFVCLLACFANLRFYTEFSGLFFAVGPPNRLSWITNQ